MKKHRLLSHEHKFRGRWMKGSIHRGGSDADIHYRLCKCGVREIKELLKGSDENKSDRD
jgi:hypothetical protein